MSLSPVNSYIPTNEVGQKEIEEKGKYNFLSTPQPARKTREYLQLNETSPDLQFPGKKTDQTEVNYENQYSSELEANSHESEVI